MVTLLYVLTVAPALQPPVQPGDSGLLVFFPLADVFLVFAVMWLNSDSLRRGVAPG